MAIQWQPAVMPTYRRRAAVQILIGASKAGTVWAPGPGVPDTTLYTNAGMLDVTSVLEPYLISVDVTLRSASQDRASIELDDRDARLPIPPYNAPCLILMGWAGSGPELPLSRRVQSIYKKVFPDGYPDKTRIQELPWRASGLQVVFQGQVDTVISRFSRRGGGRRLFIELFSTARDGKGKEPQTYAMGQGEPDSGDGEQINAVEFFTRIARNAGYSFHSWGLDGITRNFWSQDAEGFWQRAKRFADANRFEFKVIGTRAFMSPRGRLVNGQPRPTVEALWGTNLISWSIQPYSGRAQWKGGQQRFFDIWKGLFKFIPKAFDTSIPFNNASATAMLPNNAPNAQVGGQWNDGQKDDAERNRGTGNATINGEPAAQPFGEMLISGARPGVDGLYEIEEAIHHYSRARGYLTMCKLKRPDFRGQQNLTVWQEFGKAGVTPWVEFFDRDNEHAVPFFQPWQNGEVPQVGPQPRPGEVWPPQ